MQIHIVSLYLQKDVNVIEYYIFGQLRLCYSKRIPNLLF